MSEDTPVENTDTNNIPPEQPDTTPDNSGLSQADIDRIVRERLARDREAQQKQQLTEWGVDSLDEITALLKAKRDADDAELTASQQLEKQLLKEQESAKVLREQIASMQAERIASTRQSALKEAARTAGAQDVNALAVLVHAQNGDDFAALFDDENQTTDAKMSKFMKQLQSDYPFIFKTAGAGSTSNAGGILPTSRTEAKKKAADDVTKKFGSI